MAVDCACAANQTDPACNVNDASLSAVTDGQQGEQDGQAQEDELQCAVRLKGTEEHEQGEHAPQSRTRPEMGVCRPVPILGISRIATRVSQKEP